MAIALKKKKLGMQWYDDGQTVSSWLSLCLLQWPAGRSCDGGRPEEEEEAGHAVVR